MVQEQQQPEDAIVHEPSSIDMIVEGLRGKFGEAASVVAFDQIEAASLETVHVWMKVAARLAQTCHNDGGAQ